MSELKIKYYRIISLWVICECVLGGIIHGFKIPISGLFVGSLSVICICLIGNYIKEKNRIVFATILVAIFKFLLSPQSPPTAYIALFFQGLLGELFFGQKTFSNIKIYFFSIICLLESGIQRIIIMTVVYGKSFWLVVNETLGKFFSFLSFDNYSELFISIYISIHLLTGIAVAHFIIHFLKNITDWENQYLEFDFTTLHTESIEIATRKKKRLLNIYIYIWLILILLFIISKYSDFLNAFTNGIILHILFRSVFIILTWVLFVSPILQTILNKWLSKQKEKKKNEIEIIQNILPETQNIISNSWSYSKNVKGIKRIKLFLKIVLVKSLSG